MERDMDSSMLRAEVSAIGLRYEAAKLKTTRSSPRPRGTVHRETLGAGAGIGKKASSVSRFGIWITLSRLDTSFVPTMPAWSVPSTSPIRGVKIPFLSDATHH